MKSVKAPVYILGTGRSGTTILGVVLSMHRDVGFLNEPKALWHAVYPYEDIIGSYFRGDGRLLLNASDAGVDEIRNARKLYGAYLRLVGANRVVDKYPELIFRVPFVKHLFPDAKFLFLVRNGWDTCYSINEWSERFGEKKDEERHDWWGADDRKWRILCSEAIANDPDLSSHIDKLSTENNHVVRAAAEWIVTMRQGLAAKKSYGEDIHVVYYERLAEDPRTVLSDICEHLDLLPDDVFLEYAEKSLNPPSSHKRHALPPYVEEPFRQIMSDLGYAEGGV